MPWHRNDVPLQVGGGSPLAPLCVFAACLSEFSEVVGDGMVWRHSGTCSLQGPIDRVEVLEQPTCSKLACCLTREAETGGGRPREWVLGH